MMRHNDYGTVFKPFALLRRRLTKTNPTPPFGYLSMSVYTINARLLPGYRSVKTFVSRVNRMPLTKVARAPAGHRSTFKNEFIPPIR